jgi:hypothetical protein
MKRIRFYLKLYIMMISQNQSKNAVRPTLHKHFRHAAFEYYRYLYLLDTFSSIDNKG